VERARNEGAATSGARSGGRLAGFLDGDPAGEGAHGPRTARARDVVAAAAADGPHSADEDDVDASLIERLTRRPS
jgi:hypothetical protein